MSDTSHNVWYNIAISYYADGVMAGVNFDLADFPISDADALTIAAAFASVLPPAPATHITIQKNDRTVMSTYGDLAADPPVFE